MSKLVALGTVIVDGILVEKGAEFEPANDQARKLLLANGDAAEPASKDAKTASKDAKAEPDPEK